MNLGSTLDYSISAQPSKSPSSPFAQRSGMPHARSGLRPYLASLDATDPKPLPGHPPGWQELVLVRDGQRHPPHLQHFSSLQPVVENIIRSHSPVAHITFLVLQPGTKLPVHVDPFNYFTSVHMGVVVPRGCVLRVAGVTRSWLEGRCLAFNPSYLHFAANNHPSEARVILSVHVPHPRLTPSERQVLQSLERYLQECGARIGAHARGAMAV